MMARDYVLDVMQGAVAHYYVKQAIAVALTN
jgi:hypothetical protein